MSGLKGLVLEFRNVWVHNKRPFIYTLLIFFFLPFYVYVFHLRFHPCFKKVRISSPAEQQYPPSPPRHAKLAFTGHIHGNTHTQSRTHTDTNTYDSSDWVMTALIRALVCLPGNDACLSMPARIRFTAVHRRLTHTHTHARSHLLSL